jgi:hypothetical protein
MYPKRFYFKVDFGGEPIYTFTTANSLPDAYEKIKQRYISHFHNANVYAITSAEYDAALIEASNERARMKANKRSNWKSKRCGDYGDE